MKNTESILSSLETLASNNQSIHLVLSGGGAKGVAHIALIELLEEKGININAISGSSAGALVGALYTSGLQTEEILDFFKTTPIFKYTWLNPIKAGIFDSDKYAIVLKDYLKEYFEELTIPVTIAATNITQNKIEYFSTGELIKPLLASCAVPAVFSPIEIAGNLYSDGGVMDNFPIAPFSNQENPIIGSYLGQPVNKSAKALNSIFKVVSHTNVLLMHSANRHKFKSTYATASFPLGVFSGFDAKKVDEIYHAAMEYLRHPREENNVL